MAGKRKSIDAVGEAAACGGGCGNAGPSGDRSTAELDDKASSLAPDVTSQPPLPFSYWFAFQSYTTDLLLLLLDLIVIAPPYVAQQWVNRQCFPLAGAPQAALQSLPLDTAHSHVDSIMSRFPCGASYTAQLAYTVVTGAAIDPWVRVRTGDWGNLLYVYMLLVTMLLALINPRIYMRYRWPLFAANAVAHLTGNAVAAVAAPLPMLALIGPSFYGSFRRRVGVLHSAWRSLVVLRVPLAQQVALALPLWLLTAFIAHTADRRLPPAAAAAASHSTVAPLAQPLTELLSTFLAVAVLPCAVAYLLDSYLLRPRYAIYLLRQGQQQQQQQQRPVRRSPRPCVQAREVEGATSPVDGRHGALQRTDDGPSPRSHASPPSRLCAVLSPSIASPAGTGGRAAVAGSETGEAAAAGPQAGGGVAPGQQACAVIAPAATHAMPTAHNPTHQAALACAISSRPQLSKPRWGGCGSAATALAPVRLGHTRAPMHRRPTLDITLLEPQTASTPAHGPLLLPSGRAFRLSSTDTQNQPPSAIAAAGTAAISSSAAVPSAHHTPVAAASPTTRSPAAAPVPSAPQPRLPRPRPAGPSAAAATRYASSLYRQACPVGQVHTLSVKVPLRQHAGAPVDAARTAASVSTAAVTAVRQSNATATAASAEAAASDTPHVAVDLGPAPPPEPPQPAGCMRVLSSVVVAGCVHLLMVVRAVPVAVGEQRRQQQGHAAATAAAGAGGGGEPDQAIGGRTTGYATHGPPAVRHVTVDIAGRQQGTLGAGGGEGEGGAGGWAGVEAAAEGGEEAAAWELAVEQEVRRALLGMMMGQGGGLGATGGGSSSGGVDEQAGGNEVLSSYGFAWPPAVSVVAADAAAGGLATCLGGGVGEGNAGAAGREGVAVTLVVPREVLRGRRAVRCVVAGGQGEVEWGAGQWGYAATESEAAESHGELDCWSGDERSSAEQAAEAVQEVRGQQGRGVQQQGAAEGDHWLAQQQLHADVEVEVELEGQEGQGWAGGPGTPEGGGTDDACGYVSVRLPLPDSAVCAPGLLSVHLLPPRHSGASSTTSPLLPPSAPLATLPLLVLPPAAAAEVCGLYDSVVRTTDDQPTRTAARTATAAADAIASSGLDGLLYDMGTLLQLPAASSAPAPDPWVWRGLLSHLATWRMGACLQACLGALQRAGVDLRMGEQELGEDLAGVESDEDGGGADEDAGWRGQGLATAVAALLAGGAAGEAGEGVWAETHDITASCGGACPSPSLEHTQADALVEGAAGPHGTTWSCCQQGPDAANAQPATAAEAHQHQQPSDTARTQDAATSLPPAASSFLSHDTPQPPPLLPSAARSLLLGFSPAPLEHRYQQYKAASCRARDCAGLVLAVAIRATPLVRTAYRYCAAAAAGDAAAAAQYAEQAASITLWLTGGVVAAVVALCTPALNRHRTRLLLLKGLVDFLTMTAVTWPSGSPHAAASGWLPVPSHSPSWLPLPLRQLVAVMLLLPRRLPFPHTWHGACRRFGVHWLYFGVWEPTMLQLSPRFQAILAAALVLPITLFSLQLQRDISGSSSSSSSGGGNSAAGDGYGGGSWLSAAAVGVGSSLLSVVLSCATDLHCRRSFTRQQEREQERARQQVLHREGRWARAGGGPEGRRDKCGGVGGCKWEEEE